MDWNFWTCYTLQFRNRVTVAGEEDAYIGRDVEECCLMDFIVQAY